MAALRGTPSWLVSLVLHMALVIVLALIVFDNQEEARNVFVLATAALEEQPQIDILEPDVVEPEQLENTEIKAQAVAFDEIGMASLGDIGQNLPESFSQVSVANVEPSMTDIGLLFGNQGKGMADVGSGYGGAEFFGVQAGGRKFVFIVDSSKSMKDGKFEAACYELRMAVRRLTPDQFFYVMFFDRDNARMTFGHREGSRWIPNSEPEPRAVLATPENIAQFEQWMETIELELGTKVHDSLEVGVEMLPDAIYVLTDGKFGDTRLAESFLAKNNIIEDDLDGSRAKVIIHTVGFYKRDGEPTLKKMAGAYDGTYRFVPQPPK